MEGYNGHARPLDDYVLSHGYSAKDAANKWGLHFLIARNDFSQLIKLRSSTLLKIQGVGEKYMQHIQRWQKEANLSPEGEWVGKMIIQDAK